MLETLRRAGRLEMTLLLGALSLFCLALTVVRWRISHSQLFLFLNWNLFLAFIPWLLGTWVALSARLRRNRLALGLLLIAWVAFFPNAPYILTDFFHLEPRLRIPLWYDLVLIQSFAWTGLIFGFVSLHDIERFVFRRLGRRMAAVLPVLFLFITAFGVYLGRFLRWNSWDILQDPAALLADIATRVADPLSHAPAWGMTALFGLLLNLMFRTVKLFSRPRTV